MTQQLSKYLIQTARLNLRQWCDSDRAPFAQLNADPDVMRYFPNPYTRAESDAALDALFTAIEQRGHSFFAAERRDTNEFIGFIGIKYSPEGLPFAPCVDIGWRLLPNHWGKGFATEGAIATLAYGFEHIGLEEIVSMTPINNRESERVMQKIGLVKQTHTFLHPALPAEHELAEHVLYTLSKSQWLENLLE